MGMPGTEVVKLLASYDLTQADLDRVRAYGAVMVPRIGEAVAVFYAWLEQQPEFREHFSDLERLARVKQLQEEYWADFFSAQIDDGYVEKRRRVGEVHARIGLSLPVYFAAMNLSLATFADKLYDDSLGVEAHAAAIRAITKLVHLDTSLVVETYSRLTNKKIADQSQALMEMSTPVTAIWQGILMLPLVGLIDSRRAQGIMNAMLARIAETRSRLFILDISGVAVVDTAVANHLIKITRATKLMGCECTISGISPAIAQTMVELGIEVGNIQTTSTLRDALEDAFRRMGFDLRQRPALPTARSWRA
jgi:rsbT co-antagonist protein RsbR